jgi:hypothetical protein
MKKKTHYEDKSGSAACGALVTSRYLTRTAISVDCPKCKEKLGGLKK